jgi:hypothetical protein
VKRPRRWYRRFSVCSSGPPSKDVILTPEGYDKVKREIEHLSIPMWRQVRVAREFADINEDRAVGRVAPLPHDDARNHLVLL